MSIVEAVDAASFTSAFPHTTFAIRHELANNPLFTLPRLLELQARMPRDRIEFNSGKVNITQDPDSTPMVDLSPDEIIRRIETCSAWMVLKSVEEDPEYRALIDQVLLSVVKANGYNSLAEAGFHDIRGFIFVSSPNSITPFHADNENNIFVQIHGGKRFHVYDNRDNSVASEEAIEHVLIKHRNLKFDPSFDAKGVHYELSPGDGIFVPYQWPHWVGTTDGYSISMAITWKTDDILWRNDVLTVNSMLRSIGMPQSAPGHSKALDAVKVTTLRSVKAVVDPLRKNETMRRVLRRLVLGRRANYYLQTKTTDSKAA